MHWALQPILVGALNTRSTPSHVGIVRAVAQTDEPRLRVLVSAGTMGGPGGAQRALASMLRALSDDQVDVVARRVVDPSPPGAHRIWSSRHWRWVGSSSTVGRNGRIARVLNPARARLFPGYDVHIRLFQGAEVNPAVRAAVRLLVPSGNPVDSATARGFDAIAMQAPDNIAFVPEGARPTLLPPPLYAVSEESHQPSTPVPADFYLTAFNPYGAIKGDDDLARAAEHSALPIVWCHSDRGVTTRVPDTLRHHRRIVHVTDPTPAELRWLYERCAAYLCFSKSEGFGWSIADGLRHSPVVVSRDVGILTHPGARELPGIIRVDDGWQVDWSTLPMTRGALPERDLTFQAPETFRRNLAALTSSAQ